MQLCVLGAARPGNLKAMRRRLPSPANMSALKLLVTGRSILQNMQLRASADAGRLQDTLKATDSLGSQYFQHALPCCLCKCVQEVPAILQES